MTLYNYVVYVVNLLVGAFRIPQQSSQLPLYPSGQILNINPVWDDAYITTRGGYIYSAWQRVLSNPELSWWNRIASDPKLLMSTIIWVMCVWITVELCLILPFRWFKRLLRYPNHKLMTPQEVKRSKLK